MKRRGRGTELALRAVRTKPESIHIIRQSEVPCHCAVKYPGYSLSPSELFSTPELLVEALQPTAVIGFRG